MGPVPAHPRRRIGAGMLTTQLVQAQRTSPRLFPELRQLSPSAVAAPPTQKAGDSTLRCHHNPAARRGSHQSPHSCPGGPARGGRIVASAAAFRGADTQRRASAGRRDNPKQRPACDRIARWHRGRAGTSPTISPHIRLGGLSQEEVAELVAATVMSPSPTALVDRIYMRDGRPPFPRERDRPSTRDRERP